MCLIGLFACREPDETSTDADVFDTDQEDTLGQDSSTDTDEETEQDADPDHGDLAYCEFADGQRINECSDCLPSGIDQAVIDGLAVIFPNAETVRAVQDGADTYFVAELESHVLGHAFLSQSYGYYGSLTNLTGIDSGGSSIRTELTSAPPGEWTYYLNQGFYDQFRCIDLDEINIEARDWGSYSVDAVSGATITSQAIIQNIWLSFDQFDQLGL